MPRIWGLSKAAANYRQAPKQEVRCDVCRFMFPKLAVRGAYRARGVEAHAAPVHGVPTFGWPTTPWTGATDWLPAELGPASRSPTTAA